MKGTAPKPTLFALGVLISASILALAGFGLGWFLSGLQIASPKEGPGSPPAMTTPIAKPDATLPKADVPGEDFSDLPRYPDSVRVKYERRMSKAGLIMFDTEYVASAKLDHVREFYRGVFRSGGWTVTGLDVSEGEWDFLVTKGSREAVTEIETRGGLVEIEIEVSEPQKEEESRKGSASPRRPEQAAPSTTPPSDGNSRNGRTAPQSPEEPAPTATPAPEPTPTATASPAPWAPAPDDDDDSDDFGDDTERDD